MAEVTAQDDFPHFDEGGDGEATDGSGDCLSCSSTDECMALQACVRSCTQSAGQYIGRTSQRYTVTEEWKNRKLADEIFASAFYLVIMMVFQCTVHIVLVVYLVNSHVDSANAPGSTKTYNVTTNTTSYSYGYSLVEGLEGDARLIYQPAIVLVCSLAVAGLSLIGTWSPTDYDKDGNESGFGVLNGSVTVSRSASKRRNEAEDPNVEANRQAWVAFRYAITVASNSLAVGLSMVAIMSCINAALDLSTACDLRQGAFRGCHEEHIGSCLASSTCNASDLLVNGSSCRAWSYSICMGTNEVLAWDTFDTMLLFIFLEALIMLYFAVFPAFYTAILVIRHEIHKNNVTDMELRKINLLIRKHYNQNRDLGKQTMEISNKINDATDTVYREVNNVRADVGKRMAAIKDGIEEKVQGESKVVLDLLDQKLDERSDYEKMLERRVESLERMVEILLEREQRGARSAARRRNAQYENEEDDEEGEGREEEDHFGFTRSAYFGSARQGAAREEDSEDDHEDEDFAEALPVHPRMSGSALAPLGLSFSQRKTTLIQSIAARDSKVVHVDVGSAPCKLGWSMYTDGKDISFSVAFISGRGGNGEGGAGEEGTGQGKESGDGSTVSVLEPARLTNHGGSYVTDRPGTLTFFLDNSFSWVNAKLVTCNVKLERAR